MKINKSITKTSDLVLATTLSLFFPLISVNKSDPRRVQFLFKKTKELEAFTNKYWRRELKVEPFKFANQMKALKTRIYSR